MQVNNVRICLDSSSFSSTFSSSFFGFFAWLFALLLGKPGRKDPDPDPNPTRRQPDRSRARPETPNNCYQFQMRQDEPPGTGPCGCEKSEQLFA